MSDTPAEILLFDFLDSWINGLIGGDLMYGAELHDTIYQNIKTERGLRISDTIGTFSPTSDMTQKEYDVFVTIVAFSRVKGQDKNARRPAMQDVFLMQQATYAVICNDSTLGGRVCDSLLRQGARSYDSLDGEPYAVASIPLIINPTGARYAGE